MADDTIVLAEIVTPATTEEAKLSQRELLVYRKYIESGKPPLAISTQAQFFELFLNGATCDEIFRLNHNFPFGAIVRARLEGKWDEKRDQALTNMLDTVRDRVQQTQVAAIMFNADMLAAAHKMFGDRFKKYIQTGDVNELGTLQIVSLKQYKEAIGLFLQLTGQDNNKKVSGEVVHKIEPAEVPLVGKTLTPEQADALFQSLLAGKQ
jgi:hypothetical protein